MEVGRERTVRRTSREALIAGLTGTALAAAGRRGKYLICPLDSGDSVMIHLRMSGQLRLVPAGSPRPLHTHVAMELSGGEELRFIDPRTFGEVVVFDPSRADAEVPELARLGPDPMVDGLTARALRLLVRGRSRPIKGLLLDQHAVAGLGNIYSDEVLHAAGVRFDRPAGSLAPSGGGPPPPGHRGHPGRRHRGWRLRRCRTRATSACPGSPAATSTSIGSTGGRAGRACAVAPGARSPGPATSAVRRSSAHAASGRPAAGLAFSGPGRGLSP